MRERPLAPRQAGGTSRWPAKARIAIRAMSFAPRREDGQAPPPPPRHPPTPTKEEEEGAAEGGGEASGQSRNSAPLAAAAASREARTENKDRGLHLEPRSRGGSKRPEGHLPPPLSYESSARQKEPPAMGRTSPTLRRAWPKDGPLAAICVQSVDVQCVLQFTLVHAAGCVLHRRTSRVIHRLKLCSVVLFMREASGRGPDPQEAWRASQQQADMLSKRFFPDKLNCDEETTKKRPGGGHHPTPTSLGGGVWAAL